MVDMTQLTFRVIVFPVIEGFDVAEAGTDKTAPFNSPSPVVGCVFLSPET
jgi:hypothetical protein